VIHDAIPESEGSWEDEQEAGEHFEGSVAIAEAREYCELGIAACTRSNSIQPQSALTLGDCADRSHGPN